MSDALPFYATFLTRRRLLASAAGGAVIVAIGAACGDDDEALTAAPSTPTAAPATPTPAPATPSATTSASQGTVLVGDVIEHSLEPQGWAGAFGFVTFKLHTGWVDGEPVYYIRTDASDKALADAEKLVFVPKMAKALAAGGGLSSFYMIEGGMTDQVCVLSSAPHKADYSPAFQVKKVRFTGEPVALNSVKAIDDAVASGRAEVEDTGIVVNYPVVKWPGGELPNDQKREVYLGDGQLLEPVDVAEARVKFKLHSCYPSTRYIVTDVTMAPMADGMHIAPAPGAEPLTAAGATAKILVFGNGIEGTGPMGFQKSITDTVVGDPEWSPYWDHYTFVWGDATTPTVLKSQDDILSNEESGALKRFPGTPDTNGTLFMVNCPAPVAAPVA